MMISIQAIFAYTIVAIFILILLTIVIDYIGRYLESIVWEQLEKKSILENFELDRSSQFSADYLENSQTNLLTTTQRKLAPKQRRSQPLKKSLLILLLVSTIFLPSSLKYIAENPLTGIAGVQKPSEIQKTPLILPNLTNTEEQNLTYQMLADYLKQKNWEGADIITYKLLLRLAGEKSQARGYIDVEEFEKLPCDDLRIIDSLWREASNGQLGFSAQQIVYNEQGQNWPTMYEQVKWAEFRDEVMVMLVDKELNWQTRRLQYKPGMTANFKNPPPGHLPVTIGLVRGKEFPQFAELCQF